MLKISDLNMEVLDLTPFDEPVEIEVKKFGAGYVANCRVAINRRWGTQTDYLVANRVFGHRGDLSDEQLKLEVVKSIADIHEKRLFVFKANHGLLDREGDGFSGKTRFLA